MFKTSNTFRPNPPSPPVGLAAHRQVSSTPASSKLSSYFYAVQIGCSYQGQKSPHNGSLNNTDVYFSLQ